MLYTVHFTAFSWGGGRFFPDTVYIWFNLGFRASTLESSVSALWWSNSNSDKWLFKTLFPRLKHQALRLYCVFMMRVCGDCIAARAVCETSKDQWILGWSCPSSGVALPSDACGIVSFCSSKPVAAESRDLSEFSRPDFSLEKPVALWKVIFQQHSVLLDWLRNKIDSTQVEFLMTTTACAKSSSSLSLFNPRYI